MPWTRLCVLAAPALWVMIACGDSQSFDNGPAEDTKSDASTSVVEDDAAALTGDASADASAPVRSVVAVGADFACVLGSDRTVSCWGNNAFGQLGRDPGATPSSTSVLHVDGLTNIQRITAGDDFACALDASGKVSCWGGNAKSQLQTNAVASSFTPRLVYVNAKRVVAGGAHVCVINNDDLAKCWGDNACQTLSAGEAIQSAAGQVPNLPRVAELAVGADEICTITLEGRLLCWGGDHLGSLGHDVVAGTGACTVPFDPTPKSVQLPNDLPIEDAQEVKVGNGVACARRTNNQISCWGDNRSGALGQGIPDSNPHARALDVPALFGAQLDVRGQTACTIAATKVFCWGDGQSNQLDGLKGGSGSPPNCATPGCRGLGYEISGMANTREVFVGPNSIAAIKDDTSLWTWGKINGSATPVATNGPALD